MVLSVKVFEGGTFSPAASWTGFPVPDVAGRGDMPKVFSKSFAILSRAVSSRAVEEVAFEVRVLGPGTFSPGAKLFGLPAPEVWGIGFTENPVVSSAGVSGNAPGNPGGSLSGSFPEAVSIGPLPAKPAGVD
jgi:hypothetical protein